MMLTLARDERFPGSFLECACPKGGTLGGREVLADVRTLRERAIFDVADRQTGAARQPADAICLIHVRCPRADDRAIDGSAVAAQLLIRPVAELRALRRSQAWECTSPHSQQ